MTNKDPMPKNQRVNPFGPWSLVLCWSLVLGASAGCQLNRPQKANIALRKEVQALNDKLAALQSERDAAVAQARAADAARAVPTLSTDRLDKLFTASGIKFGRVVVGDDTDPNQPGDEGLKLSLAPLDQFGDECKLAGSFTIELFDLAEKESRIGTWTIPTEEAQRKWLSTFVIDAYVFELPWQTTPRHEKLLVKATFVDELTGRTFDTQRELTVKVPAAPTTQANSK